MLVDAEQAGGRISLRETQAGGELCRTGGTPCFAAGHLVKLDVQRAAHLQLLPRPNIRALPGQSPALRDSRKLST